MQIDPTRQPAGGLFFESRAGIKKPAVSKKETLVKKILLVLAFLGLSVSADESPPAAKTLSIFEHIDKAREMLSSETPAPLYRSTKNKKQMLIGKETLRVTLRPDGSLRLVRIDILFANQKDSRGKRIKSVVSSVEPEECVAERIGGGGVNSNYQITCGGQVETVLASKDLLLDSKGREVRTFDGRNQAIYVPYSDALATSEVIETGNAYIHGQISRAAEELRNAKVYSRAAQGKLVADIFSEELLFRLSLMEHIDEEEFEAKGVEYSANKVLTQFGLNKGDTFQYAISRTGALCLMQIMPSTYRPLVPTYRAAKMPKDPRRGACGNHVSGIKTAYLVLDSKLQAMPPEFKKRFAEDPETYGIYLAAAYNGGEGRARALFQKTQSPKFKLMEFIDDLFEKLRIKRGKISPKERSRIANEKKDLKVLRRETWIFIKKYFEIANRKN